ncbi:hypothetical protein CW703_07155 [Candidatus Bathyarchaeota archaeon]|nr:MAG: hypothetical protein CW703_07155 [Candidatus Bathyarchaeota archaeon]
MRLEKTLKVKHKIVYSLPADWRKISSEEIEQIKNKIFETLTSVGADTEIDNLMVDETAKSLVILQKLRKIIWNELNKIVEGKKHGKLTNYISSYEKLCKIVLNWIESLALTRKERLTLKQQENVKDKLKDLVSRLMGVEG